MYDKMIPELHGRKRLSSELSWDDLHPTDYCIKPSKKEIEWLKKSIEEDKKKLKEDKKYPNTKYIEFKKKYICKYCGKEFERYIGKKEAKFCSQQCHYSFMKGKNIEELCGKDKAEKIKELLRSQKGNKNPNYGHKWSEEKKLRQKILMKERMKSPEIRYKSGSANRGKKFSIERRKNISNGHKGKISYIPTDKTKKIIGKKSAEKWKDDNYRRRHRVNMEKRGHWIPLKHIDDFKIYCKQADWIERMFDKCPIDDQILLKEKRLFNAYNNTKGVVRDHCYSRKSGFINCVFPEILRHPANCKIITHSDNIRKKVKRYIDKNSLSLQQLFENIENHRDFWKEQNLCLELIKRYKQGERWKRDDIERGEKINVIYNSG